MTNLAGDEHSDMAEANRAKTVLVVEDHNDTRLMIKTAVKSFGYLVVEAASGWQAIEVAARVRPDLVLMDISMPTLDGFETTCLLRAQREMARVPIIAVTAYDSSDDRADAEDVGITEYITKPIDLDHLRGLISRHLIPNT